uniref:Uncharacterized protein n=1 Tax=Avena sativa TaxID=4498 RepID=A0ACD5U707_AVESA
MLWMWEHQLRSFGLLRSGRNCWNSMKESREPGCMPVSYDLVEWHLPLGLCRDIDSSTQQFASRIDKLEEMSTGNRIWKQRLVDIGTVTAQQAKDWTLGILLID